MTLEIGCSSICFRREDLAWALREIRRLDFEWADIGMIRAYCPHFDPLAATADQMDSLVEMVGKTGLKVATLNLGNGLFNNGIERGVQRDLARRCLDLASRLACYGITVPPGRQAHGNWPADARSVALGLGQLADYAEDLGLMLTVEAPHRGSLATRVQDAIALLELSHSENLRITLDTSHVLHGGMQPSEAVGMLGDRIGHVHLRDARGENIRLTPGDGDVDFGAFHDALSSAGYDRPAILELEYDGKARGEIGREAMRARDFLRGLWQ